MRAEATACYHKATLADTLRKKEEEKHERKRKLEHELAVKKFKRDITVSGMQLRQVWRALSRPLRAASVDVCPVPAPRPLAAAPHQGPRGSHRPLHQASARP
jgi:hypothetical protein